MSRELLKINRLSASYGDEDIISDVTLGMMPGEILCIAGESGSGKSTLIKAIHGMSELKITGGNVMFDGREITSFGTNERHALMGTEIGLIPQNPAASFNPIRRYSVQFREMLKGHDMPYDEDKIAELLSRIGLEDGREILRNRPYELSGGMNQRIAITAAMMLGPKLLLCDEATSALDVTTAGIVVDELLKIRAASSAGILLVTHHLGIARRMADNIGIMKDGRLVEYGSADKIFNSPENDYTIRLIRDVPRLAG